MQWLARTVDFLCDISRNPGSDEYDRSFLYPGVFPSSSRRKLAGEPCTRIGGLKERECISSTHEERI
jgi:hypothetical protein